MSRMALDPETIIRELAESIRLNRLLAVELADALEHKERSVRATLRAVLEAQVSAREADGRQGVPGAGPGAVPDSPMEAGGVPPAGDNGHTPAGREDGPGVVDPFAAAAGASGGSALDRPGALVGADGEDVEQSE